MSLLVGMTYDLRSVFLQMGYTEEETAELDREETVDAIASAIERLGHRVDRIGHARQLMQRLNDGDRWDVVFNICEGLQGVSREAQVPAILEVYGIPYTFSDPLVMAVSLHKGMTKAILLSAQVPTTPYWQVNSLEDLAKFTPTYPAFVKPIAEGTGKGVKPECKVHSAAELKTQCTELLHRFRQPVLVEPFLPGREFTVCIVGQGDRSKVLGTLEIILKAGAEPEVYSYENKERCEELVDYPLVFPTDPVVKRSEEIALQAWNALGCRDAGRVDLRCDEHGNPQVMELNPLAGLHPSHSDLPMLCTAIGMEYDQLIATILDSAAARGKRVPGMAPKRTEEARSKLQARE